MLVRLRRVFGYLLRKWVELWRRFEGPELEPWIWHSHYLSDRVTRKVLKLAGSQLRGRVVDVGAGTGCGQRYLDRELTSYYPTDLQTGRNAHDLAISLHGRSPCVFASVYHMPFRINSLDGALVLMVLEHLERPGAGLKEVFQVVRPGGLVLVSTPFMFPVHGAPMDFHRWTREGLARSLRDHGGEVLECVNCGGVFSAVALNGILGVRYHLTSNGSLIVRVALAALLPLIIPLQAFVNVCALLLDLLDGTRAAPIAIVGLARKTAPEPK